MLAGIVGSLACSGAGQSLPREGIGGPRTTRVTVEAHTHWTNTGLYLRAGQTVTLTAEGQWTFWEGQVQPHDLRGLERKSRGCRAGSLIAKVGLHYSGTRHCVGETGQMVAGASGILFLKMNDDGHQGMDDNAGSLRVQVRADAIVAPILSSHDAETADLSQVHSDWLEIVGKHVSLVVPTATLRRHQGTVRTAVATMDAWYEAMVELVGVMPFRGELLRVFPDTTISEIGWMAAENPIYVQPAVLEKNDRVDPLLAVTASGKINDYVHEMAHDFAFAYGRSYQMGRTMEEGWAHLIATYAVRQTGNPGRVVGDCIDPERFFETGSYEEFTANFGIPLCFLLEFEEHYGWKFFKVFFADHAKHNQDVIPESIDDDGRRWRWLRSAFDQAAGESSSKLFESYHLPGGANVD